jgi:POT family proton-dependent oligopeptide transporter
MQVQSNSDKFFQSKVLGHPAGLFVLFFTEMWERFSFYGMRVLLINFLTMAIIGTNPGWEWDIGVASTLFATYAGLLYLTPILGGIIADKFLGYRMSVAVGAIVMTLGHACMALDTEITLYLGLALLVIGTGFFKPTITSIISEMYKDLPQKKDGAYTIFYMGVNAGAFFGMMLCGYLAEKVGWSWGFGLAGVFMLLGLIQFWFAKPLVWNHWR